MVVGHGDWRLGDQGGGRPHNGRQPGLHRAEPVGGSAVPDPVVGHRLVRLLLGGRRVDLEQAAVGLAEGRLDLGEVLLGRGLGVSVGVVQHHVVLEHVGRDVLRVGVVGGGVRRPAYPRTVGVLASPLMLMPVLDTETLD